MTWHGQIRLVPGSCVFLALAALSHCFLRLWLMTPGAAKMVKLPLPSDADIVRGLIKHSRFRSLRLTFYVLHHEELPKSEVIAAQNSHHLTASALMRFTCQTTRWTSSQRRSALETLRDSARAAIGLTGTPLINELAEPFQCYKLLVRESAQFDSPPERSPPPKRYRRCLRRCFHVIRRRKPEVLLHLPICDVQEVDIPA